MKKTIFEKMGGTYIRQGDYLIPYLTLPEEEQRFIGVWGQRHLRYLKEYRRGIYLNLLTSGRLNFPKKLKIIGFYVLHKFNTTFTFFRIDYVRSFCYTVLQYYLRGEIFNMDESDNDSEANQFNRIFIYISQGMDYVFGT